MQQVNAMAATLRDQRLGALEATALLRKVMEEIEVAVFAFDPQQSLRLVNRAGERLLAQPAERLLARDADVARVGGIFDRRARADDSAFVSGRRGPLGYPREASSGRAACRTSCWS